MIRFYDEELAPRPTPKLKDQTLSAGHEEVSLSLNSKCASGGKKKKIRPSVCLLKEIDMLLATR